MELKVERFPYPQNLPERGFWIGLACAALLHGSLVVGLNRSAPRHLGERDGSPDAISVEFVEPSALSARAVAAPEVPTPAPPAPEPPTPAARAHPPTAPPRPAEDAQADALPPGLDARRDAPDERTALSSRE